MAFARTRVAVIVAAAIVMGTFVAGPPASATTLDAAPCEAVPDVYDSNGNSENFCDDPVGWVRLVVTEIRTGCGGRCTPAFLICQLTSPEPWNC